MSASRSCGVLLHPTSLPGKYGVGDLGPAADDFVKFLAETGQTWWQMLPLGPVGPANSPYQSPSSFAGNPLLISPERMFEDGLVRRQDLRLSPGLPEGHADFTAAGLAKERLFRAAFSRLPKRSETLDAFRESHAAWLDDFTLYTVLKQAHEGRPWYDWEKELARRDPLALKKARAMHAEETRFLAFVQYVFDMQWRRLRESCRSAGIRLIGDIPIYVSEDGADVWARPDLFLLGKKGKPQVVAGVPPDDFSKTGQRWGNPLYDWEAHARDRYQWWVRRLKGTLDRVDLVRLDHFLGVLKFYKVPANRKTARKYELAEGPGAPFLEALRAAFPSMPIIAEDLGLVDQKARDLRDAFGLPGMRVFQFLDFLPNGLGGEHLPDNYAENCVAYSGTHDNNTTIGWFESLSTDHKEQVANYLGSGHEGLNWAVIERLYRSAAKLTIVPLQDVLGLDAKARMNVPGVVGDFWSWRFEPKALERAARGRLASLTRASGRGRVGSK